MFSSHSASHAASPSAADPLVSSAGPGLHSDAECIAEVDALEHLDSRGEPTLCGFVRLRGGACARIIVPNGASTGRFEAHALRDGDSGRYRGKGVLRAVSHVRGPLRAAVLGAAASDQQAVDRLLLEADGTEEKSRLGANALLAVSLAVAAAAARNLGLPLFAHIHQLFRAHAPHAQAPTLPLPMINLFSGGKHAGRQVEVQDVLIIARSADSIAKALEISTAVRQAAFQRLLETQGPTAALVADEGGLAPQVSSNEALLARATQAIEQAGFAPLEEVALAVDVASSHFYREGGYHLAEEVRPLSAEAMISRLCTWQARYPLLSLEDGLAEDDWEHWSTLNQRIGAQCQVLGDDLLTTNPQRIRKALACKAANSVLIKLNQVGTLSEALAACALAQQAGWTTVVSARSGDTEDSWLADLAVGTAAGQIKVGSLMRSERLAKYNRLLWLAHRHPELPFAAHALDRFLINRRTGKRRSGG